MAHLHNFHKNQSPFFFAGIGQKNKVGAEIATGLKTIFDVGKTIYSAVGPAVALAALL
jgi:hypothetical protein